jgi:hypothetical protein
VLALDSNSLLFLSAVDCPVSMPDHVFARAPEIEFSFATKHSTYTNLSRCWKEAVKKMSSPQKAAEVSSGGAVR